MANPNNSSRSLADLISMFVSDVGNMPGEKGMPNSVSDLVSKNIITGDGSTLDRAKRVNPILTSNETTRTYNIGLIFAKALYDFNIKRKADKKESTIVSQAKAPITNAEKIKLAQAGNGGLGLIASIIAGVVALSALLSEYLGPVGEFITKMISKIPSVLGTLVNIKNIASSIKAGSLGKMLTNIGSRMGKRLGFLFKRLPLIGALMNFTFAYKRWQEGKYITSILEMLSGIANLTVMFGFSPGAAISLAIDGVILLSDLLSTGDMAAKTSGAIHGAKLAGKSLVKILAKTASKYGMKLLNILKFIPFIGGVAGLALAYMRFKDGDWVAGIVELAAAIADFIPGGSVVSWILDGGLLLYDILRTNKKQETSPQRKATSSFEVIKEKYGKKLMSVLWYIPGISGLLYIGRAASKFYQGDITGGIKDLGLSILGIVGGKGLVDFLSWTLGLFTNQNNTQNNTIEPKKTSFADIINSSVVSMLNTFEDIFKSIIDFAKNILVKSKDYILEEATNLIHSVNDYNPFSIAYSNVIGLNNLIEEDERLAKLGAERYREMRKRKGLDSDKAKPDISVNKDINIQQLPKNNKELEDQTNLIKLQNELLVQLVTTSKEQLNVSKKAKPSVAVVDSGSNTSNVSMNNAFSTSRPDGRSMYMSSPYSISPSFA